MNERWLNVSTVCRRLGITRHSLYRWIDSGHFAGGVRRTITGRWQITETAVARIESTLADKNKSASGASGAPV